MSDPMSGLTRKSNTKSSYRHLSISSSSGCQLVPLERPRALDRVRRDEDQAFQLQKPGGKEETIINDLECSLTTTITTTTNNNTATTLSGLPINHLNSHIHPPSSNQSHCPEPCCLHAEPPLSLLFACRWATTLSPPTPPFFVISCGNAASAENWCACYKLNLNQAHTDSTHTPKRAKSTHLILVLCHVAALVGRRERSSGIHCILLVLQFPISHPSHVWGFTERTVCL